MRIVILWKAFALSICLATVSGCVNTRYAWNDYDQKLYHHYRDPVKYDEFIAQLKEIIADGEESGRVPPGLYAEYGFTLYEKGDFPESSQYFKLESDKWPESRVLMTKMISNAQLRGKKQSKPVAAEGSAQ